MHSRSLSSARAIILSPIPLFPLPLLAQIWQLGSWSQIQLWGYFELISLSSVSQASAVHSSNTQHITFNPMPAARLRVCFHGKQSFTFDAPLPEVRSCTGFHSLLCLFLLTVFLRPHHVFGCNRPLLLKCPVPRAGWVCVYNIWCMVSSESSLHLFSSYWASTNQHISQIIHRNWILVSLLFLYRHGRMICPKTPALTLYW